MIQEKLIYKNHLNETFDLTANGLFVEHSDLYDYNWKVTQKNKKLAGLSREPASRSLPVVILCHTEAEGTAARNRLFEVAEKDVLAQKPGRLMAGEYYLKCYITGSKKENYLITRRHMRTELTVFSDQPFWVKESTFRFLPAARTRAADNHLDMPHDWPVDYTSDARLTELLQDGFADCGFRMVFYGPCTAPAVYVGGHKYQVHTTVQAGEYLTVDSNGKTVVLTTNTGEQASCFADRDREAYLFRPISPGVNKITWDGSFGFDITLLEERSEPKWI